MLLVCYIFRPFIFTFSTRRNFLYCTAFGRDRALMHLVNQVESGQNDGESGRLTPRLERRKVSVKRDDLLRQAEQTFHHLGSSRLSLQIQNCKNETNPRIITSREVGYE